MTAQYNFTPLADMDSEVDCRSATWDGRPRAMLSIKHRAGLAARVTALGPDECDQLAAVLVSLARSMRSAHGTGHAPPEEEGTIRLTMLDLMLRRLLALERARETDETPGRLAAIDKRLAALERQHQDDGR